MQGTDTDASRCSGSVASDAGNRSPEQVCRKGGLRQIGSTRTSRNQRDTLRISWNVVCKLVFIRFFQNVKSTFCTVSRGFKLGIVYQFPAKTTTIEQFPRSTCCIRVFCHNITQLCRRMTPTYHCSTLNETLLERQCFQARFLVFQTMTRRRRASQGIVDTTTVHHQSSRNLSRFRLPVLQNPAARTELLSSTNACRQLRHAVCRCLSPCCR